MGSNLLGGALAKPKTPSKLTLLPPITKTITPKKTTTTPKKTTTKPKVIKLKPKPKEKKLASISSQLKKIETLPLPIKVIASPQLTGALAGTLGLLTGAGVLPSLGIGLGIPTVGGVIKASPKAEGFIKERLLQPEKLGVKIGGIIEDPLGALKKTTTAAKIIGGGVVGAGLVGAGILGVKKLKEVIPNIPKLTPPVFDKIPVTPISPIQDQKKAEVSQLATGLPSIEFKPKTKNIINIINQVI